MTNINTKQYTTANVFSINTTIAYKKDYELNIVKYAKRNTKTTNITKYLTILLIFCVFLSILINPNKYIESARNAIFLWGNSVLPALFPFMFLTKILFEIMPKKAKSPAVFIFFLSILSGYPISSKLLSGYTQNNELTQKQAKKIFTFTSTSGPVFVIGTIGALFFNSVKLGVIIYLVHILSSLINGLVFGAYTSTRKHKKHITTTFFKKRKKRKNTNYTLKNDINNIQNKKNNIFITTNTSTPQTYSSEQIPNVLTFSQKKNEQNKNYHNQNEHQFKGNSIKQKMSYDNISPSTKDTLSNSIYSSISSILLVGAYIMLFYILFDVLCASHFVSILCKLGTLLKIPTNLTSSICSGIFELTRGAYEISKLTISPLTASLVGAFVSFSGFCILLQQYTFLRPTGISFAYILLTKLTHALITFALLYPIFSLFNCI